MPSPAQFEMLQRLRAGGWRPRITRCQKSDKAEQHFPVQRTTVPSNAKRKTVERMAPYAKNHWMRDALVSHAQEAEWIPRTFKPVTDLLASGAGGSASLVDIPVPSATSVSGCESFGVVSARLLSSSRVFSAGSSVEPPPSTVILKVLESETEHAELGS